MGAPSHWGPRANCPWCPPSVCGADHILCLHLTTFSWHAIFGLPCRTGTMPVPVYIFCSRFIPRRISGTRSVVLEYIQFYSVHLIGWKVFWYSLLSALCLGSHYAIRGGQLTRMHVLWRRLASAFACAAALPKHLFVLYRNWRVRNAGYWYLITQQYPTFAQSKQEAVKRPITCTVSWCRTAALIGFGLKVGSVYIIGASVSEPHPCESNWDFSYII